MSPLRDEHAAREAFAIDARLTLAPGTDPRAPGGAVTVALCGHWEHEGACRWPHNSRIDTDAAPAHLRTVVVAAPDDRTEIVATVEDALRVDSRWSVEQYATEPVHADEHDLAARLAR